MHCPRVYRPANADSSYVNCWVSRNFHCVNWLAHLCICLSFALFLYCSGLYCSYCESQSAYSQHTRWHLILIAELARDQLRLSQVRLWIRTGTRFSGTSIGYNVRSSASSGRTWSLDLRWNGTSNLYASVLLYCTWYRLLSIRARESQLLAQLTCDYGMLAQLLCYYGMLAQLTSHYEMLAQLSLRPCATTCATVVPLWVACATSLATLRNYLCNYLASTDC